MKDDTTERSLYVEAILKKCRGRSSNLVAELELRRHVYMEEPVVALQQVSVGFYLSSHLKSSNCRARDLSVFDYQSSKVSGTFPKDLYPTWKAVC